MAHASGGVDDAPHRATHMQDEEAVFDPWEQPADLDGSNEEPELVERGGFFRRRRR